MPLSQSSIIWYKGLDALRLGRSNLALTMHHKLSGIPTYSLSA